MNTPAAGTSCSGGYLYQDLGTLGQGQSFDLSVWVYPVQYEEQISVLLGWNHAGSDIGDDDVLMYPDHTEIDAWGTSNTSLPALSYNSWHHVRLVVDGSTLTSTLYVDGQAIGSTPAGTAFASAQATVLLGQGDGFNSTGDHFYYDDVALTLSGPPTGGPVTSPELPNGTNPSEPNAGSSQGTCGDPINTANGDFSETFPDLWVPGRGIALDLSHTYNSVFAGTNGPLGYGWTFSYNLFLTQDPQSGAATIHQEDGSQVTFALSGGTYSAPPRVVATLVKNGDGTFTFTRDAQVRYTFSAAGLLTKEQDLNGYTTSLSYNGSNQLTSVTDPAGRSLSFGYTGALLTSVSDPSGRQVLLAYNDGAGNLTDVTDANGGVTHFTYDPNHLLLTMTDPRGGVTTNHYNAANQVDWQTDPMNRKTTFAYNPGSTTITDPKGNVTIDTYEYGELVEETCGVGTPQAATTDFTYDPATLGGTSEVDPNGNEWDATYDASGNLLTATDPLGNQTVKTYNSFNELTTSKDPNGVTTTYSYDAQGNLTSVSTPLNGTNITTTFTHGDSTHPDDVTSVTDPDGAGHVTNFTYDGPTGNLLSSTDPIGNKTTYGYDSIGRLTSAVSPKGNASGGNPSQYTTAYVYNPFDEVTSVTDPLGHQTVSTYDPNGNLHTYKDARGNITTYTYNADDELTQIQRPDMTTQGFGYDADGNRQTVTDGLQQSTTYGYDSLNRLTSVLDPLNRQTQYSYDRTGNMISEVDALGHTTGFAYDAANRLTGIAYNDTSGNTKDVSFGYDADGQRTSMTEGTGSGQVVSTYTYDALNRLIQSKQGSGGQVIGYGYDAAGNLTSLTYPGTTGQVLRTYDNADRLQSIKDWLNNTTSFAYDSNSNLQTQTYPNGTTANFSYNAADQLTQIQDKKGNSVLYTFGYGRNELGNLASASDPIQNASHTYSYDSLERLASDATASGTKSWTYDAADQLKTITDTSANTSTTLGYDAAHELTSYIVKTGSTTTTNLAISYNANGDRTGQTDSAGSGSATYGYDRADRLISFTKGTTTAGYGYNGDGLRVSKTVNGSTTQQVWDLAEGLPLLLQDGSTSYVTGPGGLPLEQISGSKVLYYYQDQLGSTRLILDGNAHTQATYSFDAYGALKSSTGSASNPFGYAGQYTDSESGLQYLRTRYYDPNTQQSLTVDPLASDTEEPYAYAADDPLNLVDPSGLCALGGNEEKVQWGPEHVGTKNCTAVITGPGQHGKGKGNPHYSVRIYGGEYTGKDTTAPQWFNYHISYNGHLPDGTMQWKVEIERRDGKKRRWDTIKFEGRAGDNPESQSIVAAQKLAKYIENQIIGKCGANNIADLLMDGPEGQVNDGPLPATFMAAYELAPHGPVFEPPIEPRPGLPRS